MLRTVHNEPTRRTDVRLAELPAVQPDPERVAVLLNRNARRVTDRMARRMESVVGRDNVFFSRSVEEAEGFSREIVQQGYGTVVCGGGDGTLVRALNLVRQYVDESNAWRLQRFRRFNEVQSLLGLPRFAFLKLGTGNGLATVVGASDPVDDLRRIIDYGPGRTHALPMIDLGEDRCFIAGLGYDSMLLNDYNWLKQHTRNRFLKPLMHTVVGYFAAMLSRTLPRAISGRPIRVEARVTNQGKAYYIDPRRGDAVQEIPPGATLFEGPAALIGAGTMPFYGFGLRIFPFANMMPNMMHLRVARLGPFRTLANLPSIWRGSFRDVDNAFDFLVNDVHIELEKPFPFQHSGDDQGLRDRVDLRVADDNLELVDYYRPRPLT